MYGYGMFDYSDITRSVTIGVILGVVFTILAFIFVIPEKRRAQNSGFLKKMGELFSVEYLLTEKINKFVYVLTSIGCITTGFCLIFAKHASFGTGIAVMIGGPIVARIIYEYMMLFVILTKNTMQINAQLKGDYSEPDQRKPQTDSSFSRQSSLAYTARAAAAAGTRIAASARAAAASARTNTTKGSAPAPATRDTARSNGTHAVPSTGRHAGPTQPVRSEDEDDFFDSKFNL